MGTLGTLLQGSPTPGLWTATGLWPVRNQATEKEVSSRQANEASSAALHRSPSLALPPEPSPALPWSVEKLSSSKLVPGAKKVGDCCLTSLLHHPLSYY